MGSQREEVRELDEGIRGRKLWVLRVTGRGHGAGDQREKAIRSKKSSPTHTSFPLVGFPLQGGSMPGSCPRNQCGGVGKRGRLGSGAPARKI